MSVLEELRHGIDKVIGMHWSERLISDQLERRTAPALLAMAMLDTHPDLRGLPDRLSISNGSRGATVVLRRDSNGLWGLDGLQHKDFVEFDGMLSPLRVVSEVVKAWGPKNATPQLIDEIKQIAFGSDLNDEEFDESFRVACGRISLNANVGFMIDPVATAYALQWVQPFERAQRVMETIERNSGIAPNHTDKYGRTLLHEWASSPSPQMQSVKMLVSGGADPNAKDGSGLSPMHFVTQLWGGAVRRTHSWSSDLDERVDVFRNSFIALLEAGGDPHLKSDLGEYSSLSVLGYTLKNLERFQGTGNEVIRNILARDIEVWGAANQPAGPKPF